jgi:hypothetical protein
LRSCLAQPCGRPLAAFATVELGAFKASRGASKARERGASSVGYSSVRFS